MPSNSEAANVTEPRPAPSKPKAILASTAAQTPARHLEGLSSRPTAAQNPPIPSERPFRQRHERLTLFTSSQQEISYPADTRLGAVQKDSWKALPQQHRRTPTHALIAQHSPAAPLSKVPTQSYRVAPGNQNRDLRARYQGTARIPQPNLPALPVQPKVWTGPESGATDNASLKGRETSLLPSNQQEEHSLPVGSRFLGSGALPTGPRNKKGQSSGDPNAGASAPQGSSGIVEKGHSIRKDKRKKGAT